MTIPSTPDKNDRRKDVIHEMEGETHGDCTSSQGK